MTSFKDNPSSLSRDENYYQFLTLQLKFSNSLNLLYQCLFSCYNSRIVKVKPRNLKDLLKLRKNSSKKVQQKSRIFSFSLLILLLSNFLDRCRFSNDTAKRLRKREIREINHFN